MIKEIGIHSTALALLLVIVLPASAAPPQLTPEQQAKLDNAKKLNTQAVQFYGQARYAEGTKLAEQALAIREQVLGRDHPDVSVSLNNLALLYKAQSKYAQAEPLYQRALQINEKTQGPDHPDVATSLNNLAELYRVQGTYAQAEPIFQRALTIEEKALGPNHPSLASTLNNLASLYAIQGKYLQAESLYQRALKIRESAHKTDHPDVAQSLNNLALLYSTQGKYSQAEPLYERAIKIGEKSQGPDHPDVAAFLGNLAELYRAQGKYEQAEPLYQRALEIDENVFGPNHPEVANSLKTLALLYDVQGEYARAEPLYQQALKIQEKVLGPGHPLLANNLNNLALLYLKQDKTSQAEPLFRRALKIKEEALGPNHPSLAPSLSNLASLYENQGKYAEAEPLYQRAMKIQEAALGPDHPDTALCYDNLSALQAKLQQWSPALANQDQARRIIRRYVARELPTLSAKDQLTFLKVRDEGSFYGALSLGLFQRQDPRIAAASSAWLVNGKAVAQEALMQSQILARASNDPQVAANLQQLLEVRRQLAALVMAGAEGGQEKDRKNHVDELQRHEEDLARMLARSAGQTEQADPWIETATLRRAIPANSVLVDVARFDVFNLRATGTDAAFGPAHFAAWLVPPTGKGEIKIVDLGAADKIEDEVRSVQSAMQQAMGSNREAGEIAKQGEGIAEKLIQKPLADLAKLVLEPLRAALPDDTKQIILSPDAALWLVPWGALPLGDNKYAIEEYQIRYLVSARDLLTQQTTNTKPTPPAVFANPDYDLEPSAVESATRSVLRGTTESRRPVGAESIDNERRSLSGAKTASALPKVGRLPGTATEAVAIKSKLASYANKEPNVYLDRYATEGVFKALKRPQVLVLSTHGFFLLDQELKHDARGPLLASAEQRSVPLLTIDGKPVENPLLRCGLLLAGCNTSTDSGTASFKPVSARADGESADDGILTGLEIVGTDLRGTELVVLSACETGLGQVHNGEGVAGLRQAFQLAGAKSVVATLWQIPDQDSAQIVNRFFANLAEGQSKADALRNAQLAQIELHRSRFGAAHPFFWAAFTITGE